MESGTFAKDIVEDARALQRSAKFTNADSAIGYVGKIVVHNSCIGAIGVKHYAMSAGTERIAQKHWPMCNSEYKPPLPDNQRRANHFRALKSSPPIAVNATMPGSGTAENEMSSSSQLFGCERSPKAENVSNSGLPAHAETLAP